MITVSQVLGTAAMLAGLHVRGLDQTGLSQKAGPVVSDLRITRDETAVSNHANASGVDCLLAFDLLVGASDANLAGVRPDRTVVIASTDAVPTGTDGHASRHRPTVGRRARRARRPGESLGRQPLPRRRGPGRRAARFDHHRQHPAARRRGAGRRDPRSRRRDRAGDHAQRGGGRHQPRRVPMGPGVDPRRRVGRACGGARRVPPVPSRSTTSSSGSPPTSSVTSPRATPTGSVRWSAPPATPNVRVRRRVDALQRGGRPQPAQADGLQGRVRGRPPAARRRRLAPATSRWEAPTRR